MPGLFAAGDVRHGSIKRCASAVGEGAMAVAFVHRYLAVGLRQIGVSLSIETDGVCMRPPTLGSRCRATLVP